MKTTPATIYAIKVPNTWNPASTPNWVRCNEQGGYQCISALPSTFFTKQQAQAVIKQYKEISKNCGKAANKMEIVEINL